MRARVVVVGRGDAGAGVCGSLLSLISLLTVLTVLAGLMLESLIVGDVARFDMRCGGRGMCQVVWCVVCVEFRV